jgi:hypothetical protein
LNDKYPDLEGHNLEMLIQSAYDPTIRLESASRERVFSLLVAELKARQVAAEFPVVILVPLTLLVVAAAAWVVLSLFGGGITSNTGLVSYVAALLVLANLLLTPLAGIVIVTRRKRHGQ